MDHGWQSHSVHEILHGSGLASRHDIYEQVLSAIHTTHQCNCSGSLHECTEEIMYPNTNPGVLLFRAARSSSSNAVTHICMSTTRKRSAADDEETLFAYGYTVHPS
jgi:hypothetical protein